MSGEDILRVLSGIDYRLVMLAAPAEKVKKARAHHEPVSMKVRAAVLAAVIALIICAVPIVQSILYVGQPVINRYEEVIGRCDAAVFAKYKSKTTNLSGADYSFQVTEVLHGELTENEEITVNSTKKTVFSKDDMSKYEKEANARFKEDVEYFLALSVDNDGDVSFLGEQVIATDSIENAKSESDDFIAFLNSYGITVECSREDLIEFLRYIFENAALTENCNHSYGEWVITRAPTDGVPGERTKSCTLCRKQVKESFGQSDDLEYSFDAQTGTGKVVSIGKCKDTVISVPKYVDGYLITHIGASAFERDHTKDYKFTGISLPDSITTIEEKAFYNCYNLTSINIPSSVTSIAQDAFRACSNVESISVAEGNEFYHSAGNCLIDTKNKKLILGCSNGEIPTDGSVTGIGDWAFMGRSNLKTFTIPDGITSIGESAFANCGALRTVEIPDSVTSIGAYAFSGCEVLEYLKWSENVNVIPKGAFYNCRCVSNIVFPEGITTVEEAAFRGCFVLKDIPAFENLTSIGDYAFYQCKSITEANLSNKLKTMGKHAFDFCTSLTKVNIPPSLKEIPEYAFYQCFELYDITIQNGITSIGAGAFDSCAIWRLVVPGSVTRIGSGAFAKCHSLINVTIPDSVTDIGGYAFSECMRLTSITLPRSLTHISVGTFLDCQSLSTITIPEKVTVIDANAFYNCLSLTNVTILGNVTEIGEGAFSLCMKLVRINYPTTKDMWASVTKGYEWDNMTPNYTVYCSDGTTRKE